MDLAPGQWSSSPHRLTPDGSRLFFASERFGNGVELTLTDGTAPGTRGFDFHSVRSSHPRGLAGFNWRMYCIADRVGGRSVFVVEGAQARELRLDPATLPGTVEAAMYRGFYLFRATDPNLGSELFVSDGTPMGTGLLLDLGPGDSNPQRLRVSTDKLFFLARTAGTGLELWATDGTRPNTSLLADIRPGASSASYDDMIPVGRRLFFLVDDHRTGRELWVSDGTPAGTRQVIDLMPGPGHGAMADSLYRLPGTDRVVFAGSDGNHGLQMWTSDGTTAGTRQLGRIGSRSGIGAATLGPFHAVGTDLFFACDGGTLGEELWKFSLIDGQSAFAAPYGLGCLGARNRVPKIAARGLPVLGNAGFALELQDARPAATAVTQLAAASTSISLGPCRRLLSPPLAPLASVRTNFVGQASTPLPIPNNPVLLGARVYGQYFVLDPQGSYAGRLAFSDGLQMVLGR